MKMSLKGSKDSFERFGDDLTELLLSHLSIDEKFKYECVSKQWQTLIFNKIYNLNVSQTNDKYYDNFDVISKKCKFINNIELYFSSYHMEWDPNPDDNDFMSKPNLSFNDEIIKTFDIMNNNFRFLTYFTFASNNNFDIRFVKSLDTFGRTFGKRLQYLKIKGLNCQQMIGLLKKTPNVKTVIFDDILVFTATIDGNYLYKLENISLENFTSEQLIQFSNKFCKQMKRIKIDFHDYHSADIMTEQLSRFENLETLDIILFSSDITREQLMRIGRKCEKLTELSIVAFSSTAGSISVLFQAINEFKNLLKLKISDRSLEVFYTINSFSFISQLNLLKHLSIDIIKFKPPGDESLHEMFPNLKTLRIYSTTEFTEVSFHNLAKLQDLISVDITMDLETQTDSIFNWIMGSPKLKYCSLTIYNKEISFRIENNSRTEPFIQMCRRIANLKPKCNFKFCVGSSDCEWENINGLPNNLIVKYKPLYQYMDYPVSDYFELDYLI